MDIRQRGQAKVETLLTSPFKLIAKNFFCIKITFEIIQDILLIGRIIETDEEKIIPVSPVIIVFLRIHSHIYYIL